VVPKELVSVPEPIVAVPAATTLVNAVNVEEPPIQIAADGVVMLTTGKAVGVTTTEAVVEQPPPEAVKV
jgi:hypothetical protein